MTSTAASPISGAAALSEFAPEPRAVLVGLEDAAWQAMADAKRLELFDLASRVVSAQHALPALSRPPRFATPTRADIDASKWRSIQDLNATDRAALEYAEQVSFDVASTQAAQRSALFTELGADALPFAQAIYVSDIAPRARNALDVLFGASASPDTEGAAEGDIGHLVNELIRVVPALQAIDPVTTELVRLLGARKHQCRVCLSVRSHSAMVEGANDAMFDAVPDYASSDFSDAQKAALAFAEAMINSPGSADAAAATALRAHFSAEACVELVLDVTRNATNKVAVALGGDAPRVETGYEVYDVRPDGEIIYGLEAP
jgi:alkylhydroperoxidase family enzyme